MIGPLIAILILAAIGAGLEAACLSVLLRVRPQGLLTENYRGLEVIGRGGVSFACPALGGLFGGVIAGSLLGGHHREVIAGIGILLAFGAIGWLDDTYGAPGVRGMKGHVGQLLRHRRVTSGLVKAIAGTVVGLCAGAAMGARGWSIIPAGAVVALSANAMNSLDARPGRAAKAFTVAAAALLAVGCLHQMHGSLLCLAGLFGAALVFAPADLKEKVMLGDTGANLLGCALGMTVIGVAPWPAWVALSVVLFAFCLAADRWSLTSVVERAALLRWLDEVGRPASRTRSGNR